MGTLRKMMVPLLSVLALQCSYGEYSDGIGADTGGTDNRNGDRDSVSDRYEGIPDTAPERSDVNVCHTATVKTTRVPARVMLLEDKSQSMLEDNKWNFALDAVASMLYQFDTDIAFGVDLFSIGAEKAQSCEVGESAALDTALDNGNAVMTRLTDTQPGGATPLLLAMMNFAKRDYAPTFADGEAESYLVIVSDGEDTCGDKGEYDRFGGAAADELGDAAASILAQFGIRTVAIGFGDGINPEQLNAVAAAGGTVFTEYLEAVDGETLSEALTTIAEKSVSCTYDLGEVDDLADLDLVNVYFEDRAVPRDDGCDHGVGWTWVDHTRRTIRFCERQCSLLEASESAEVVIKIMCDESKLVVV